MPANYMRRCDLLLDAGFDDPDARVTGLAEEVSRLHGSVPSVGHHDELDALRGPLAERAGRLPRDQAALAALVPEWLTGRDGQSRWFPSRKALDHQLDKAGFEVRLHELHDHWGYSEQGRRDVFHYVLCSPRAELVGAAI